MSAASRPAWLAASERRVGLGCMRLSTGDERNRDLAFATIAEAAAAGVTVFDTARSYGRGASELGHNERLLADALRRCGATSGARIVTKGGMARTRGAWIPDGRARTIRADCEASLADLGGLAIDTYLVHVPDPRTPWKTMVRALARLVDDGLVGRIGVANVNRAQLDEALELASIAAVEVAVSPFDDRALRGGVLDRCAELGIAVLAHSPLGGPRRAPALARLEPLGAIARAHDATAAEVALAWLLGLSPNVVVLPGARRPETARSAAAASSLELTERERELLDRAFEVPRPARAARAGRKRAGSEVVVVMGIPGAGKSRVAEEYVGRGHERLNRDERGGTLRALAGTLDETLAAGGGRVVLDNTYLTRAERSRVLEAAARHGVPVRCIWLDTPLAAAQVNLVQRLLDRYGSLPSPDELARLSRTEPGVLAPTSQMRALRDLEPPAEDEGFTTVERVEFSRVLPSGPTAAGVFVAAAALRDSDWVRVLGYGEPEAPRLVFDWIPDARGDELASPTERLAAAVPGPVESAVCPHPGGPPVCWCRPPLPGLCLAFAHRRGVAPSSSILVGSSPAHRTLAGALGARYAAL
jgi:aryl-alcohol dehydrogenase-like predicted oxidoreductase/predicted kinase